jgi:DNA/RNA endonuclease YhcR with UshA esterase domain
VGTLRESSLLKISFFGAIAFFVLSLWMFENLETQISEIDRSYIGKYTCVKGVFSKVKEYKTCILGKIEDKTGYINVFCCNSSSVYEILSTSEKINNIKLCGKLKEYNGNLEIIPTKALILK